MADRQKDYGDYDDNFRLLAIIFNVILHDILKDDIQPHQVAQLMMGLKLLEPQKNLRVITMMTWKSIQKWLKTYIKKL